MRFGLRMGSVFALFILCATLAMAQDTASLNGRVSDASGASVLNATVTAVKQETNQKFTALTGSSGEYFLPSLPNGHYNITATAEGFSKKTEENIEVSVDATVTVDFSLIPGSVATSVVVNANAVELETTSPTIDTQMSARAVETLPMNVRDILAFATLIPGVSPLRGQIAGGNVQGGTGAGSFIVNGRRQSDNVIYLNGAMISQGNGAVTFLPNLDGIQEFTMYTALIPAKYGIMDGGQMVISTKSGTNQIHGDVFEYYRNSAFDATNYFASNKTPYHRNDFGGTVGGPVYIPKLFNGLNKAWFFFSLNKLRTLQYTSTPATVPTVAMKQGIFTTNIKNPSTGAYYADNTIPKTDMSPIALQFLQFYPDPTNSNATLNYISPNSTLNTTTDQYMVKGDFQRNPTDRISGQFVYDKTPALVSSPIARWSYSSPLNSLVATVGDVHVFRDSIVNNASLSYFRRLYVITSNPAANCTFATGLGIQGFPTNKADLCGVPTIGISNYGTYGDASTPGPVIPANWWGAEQVSFQKGKHLIEAGADWRRQDNNYKIPTRTEFAFDGVYSGNAWADFLLGLPYEVLTGGGTFIDQRMNSVFLWAQDAWKIAPRLTLSYGLRYESRNSVLDKSGLSANLDRATGVISPALESKVYPDGDQRWASNVPLVTFSHKSGFLPRLGLAYSLSPDVLVRAGYSMTASEPIIGEMQYLGTNPRPGLARTTIANNTKTPIYNFSDPFTAKGTSAVPNASGMDNPFKLERTHEWSLSVQNKLLFNSMLELSYVGSHTQNMIEMISINDVPPSSTAITQAKRPYPSYAYIYYSASDGDADFNGLGAKWVKQPGKDGLMFLSSFSWSKAMDNTDSRLSIAGEGVFRSINVPLSKYRGLSSSNVGLRFSQIVDYQLPFGYGKKWVSKGIASQIIGNWSFQVIESSQSGPWLTVARTTNINTGSTYSEHPDKVVGCNVVLPKARRSPLQFFNTACFVTPATGTYTYGNAGRSSAPGPGKFNVDVAIHRDFRLPHEEVLQIRMEAFNALNHGEFAMPNGTWGAAAFGSITGALYSRQIQFVGKWKF